MREFGFELRLCARRETPDRVVSRQLGGGVHAPANRVVDVVELEPGPEFEERTRITPETIPDPAIRAEVGVGRARYWKPAFEALDVGPERAEAALERAIEIGFYERERRNGRTYVRQTARYPEWVGRLRAIENKPDLGRPGALERQLRTDVSLGLFDEVVLATASHVTRAHLNRLPDPVGVWEFDPDAGELTVVREPDPLPVGEPGVELLEVEPGRAGIRIVEPAAKRRARRRVAERAYGKGWRTYALPGCANARAVGAAGTDGLPGCGYHGRLVDPASECGPGCPGYEPADPPPADLEAERDAASAWVADPEGYVRRQTGLDRFR